MPVRAVPSTIDDLQALAGGLGVLLRRDLPVGGPTQRQFDQMIRAGRLAPLRRGAGLPAGSAVLPEHRWLAALLAGGPDALLTGEVGCWLHGLRRARRDAPALVLAQHRSACRHPEVLRTTRLPLRRLAAEDGRAWPVAPLPRAVADAVRRRDEEGARALVGEALSTGRVSARELVHELTAPRIRSAVVTTVLRDLDAGGVWSVPEGDLLDLVRTSCVLPPPQMNILLVDVSSELPLLRPDALWWRLALCGSVDSREHHGETEQWAQTLDRALTGEARGLLHVHVTPATLARRPQEVLLTFERHARDRWGAPMPEGMERRPDVPAPNRGQRPR